MRRYLLACVPLLLLSVQTPVYAKERGADSAGQNCKPKKKKSGMKKLLGILATILVVLVVIGIKSGARSMFSEDPLEDAVVGSCLTDTPKAEDTEVIVCTDAKAGYTVVGKVADVSKAKFDADPDGALCSAFPSAKTSLWVEKGTFLLCLDEK